MPEIVLRPTGDLTPGERAAVMSVMSEAFHLTVPVEQVTEYYCTAMPRVLLAWEGKELVGFQFYRDLEVEGMYVCQFSLAGKAAGYRSKGLQRAFGARLLSQSLGRILHPFRRLAIVGVSNNPKSYRNMLLIGGSVFPDVTQPDQPFKYRALYQKVARRLGIQGLDLDTGVVRDRCASLGLRMRETAFEHRNDPINQGFMNYIGGDTNHGIFTMAVSTPLVSVASFASQQLGLARRRVRHGTT